MTPRFYTTLPALLGFLLSASACAGGGTSAPLAPEPRRFEFARDVLAFPNELLWEYEIDPVSGTETARARSTPVEYGQRCPLMARLVRQFYLHARFDAGLERVDADTYERLVLAVRAGNPRRARPVADPIVIPGYDGLRSFSADHAALLKRVTGGSWRSYLQRGNWRMIFPFSPGHQAELAERLVEGVEAGELPILHLMTFPRVRLNHSVLVFAYAATPTLLRFDTYDPNVATQPRTLVYDRALRQFDWVETSYFAGGRVDAYEIYRGALY